MAMMQFEVAVVKLIKFWFDYRCTIATGASLRVFHVHLNAVYLARHAVV